MTTKNNNGKKEAVTQTDKYIIHGYRWFDKINGNTYHTVTIDRVRDHKRIYESEFIVYGYDEQYKQTAYDELIKLELVKEEDRFNHTLNRDRFFYYVTDVNRKKDLTRGF